MLSESELEAKYKIVYVKKQRYYIVDLSNKNVALENATPYSLEFGDKCFLEGSWKHLLINTFTELLKEDPTKKDILLNYRCEWNGKPCFYPEYGSNFEILGEGIYLYCNFSATRAFWVLRDILMIFGYDLSKALFIIHKPPGAENTECRQFFEEKNKKSFRFYYSNLLKHSEEKTNQVLRNLEKLNTLMPYVSKSYNNLFLFDSYYTFCNYQPRLIDYMKNKLGLSSKNIEISEIYLRILCDFYKTVY